MKLIIILSTLFFSQIALAQAMNTKGSDLYSRAIKIQKECALRIIKFNKLINSGKLTERQRKKILSFKNNRINIYRKMESIKTELKERKLVNVWQNK